MPVYVIAAGETGMVKIGWADDVAARLSDLQGGNHEELTLLRCVEGPRSNELWFHRRFASNRVRREWFQFHADMLTAEPIEPEQSEASMDAIRAVRGMQVKVAKGLGITKAAVSMWLKVPAERVVDVEQITGIPRQQLRPDLFEVAA